MEIIPAFSHRDIVKIQEIHLCKSTVDSIGKDLGLNGIVLQVDNMWHMDPLLLAAASYYEGKVM